MYAYIICVHCVCMKIHFPLYLCRTKLKWNHVRDKMEMVNAGA